MEALHDHSIVLTGIKPTGRPHLGNYLGTIRPALKFARDRQAFYFIADYHALTTLREPARLNRLIHEVAATWLALGLDPDRVVFYRQSAVPEIFELAWTLACTAAKGLLNRAHAYKAAVEANQSAGRDPDAEINAGLYNYPVLMAADILAFGTDRVPVGLDQVQHVEIARDIAAAFNHAFGAVLKPPQALIRSDVDTVTGLDGRKMSKSYGNEIPIMAPPEELKRLVMRIVTDSRRPEEPKDPESCNVFAIYRHLAPPADIERVRRQYLEGGVAYQRIKTELGDLLAEHFAPARRRFDELMGTPEQIAGILTQGAVKARRVARRTLMKVRRAVGIDTGALPGRPA
jgi:tryptophanyl-tRNA synthetase